MDATQLHWTCQLQVCNEIQGSVVSPGRLGQVLYPYWKKDMNEGRVTREQTLEVLELKCATASPALTMIYDGKLSDRVLLTAIECNKSGTGYPAWGQQ